MNFEGIGSMSLFAEVFCFYRVGQGGPRPEKNEGQ
jgi:hypothetical protein